MLPPAYLGYVAAALDIGGRIQVKNNKRRAAGSRQITISLQTKSTRVTRALATLTGTSPDIFPSKPVHDWMRAGCTEHCLDDAGHLLKHIPVSSVRSHLTMPPTMKWTVTGAAAAVVLHNVLPFLTTDGDIPWRDTYDEIMKQTVLTGQGAAMVLKVVRRLRELGWDIPAPFEAALNEDVVDAEIVDE